MAEVTANSNKTEGTNFDDVIHGRDDGIKNGGRIGDGNVIEAGLGDDVVLGGAENEKIWGEEGDDTLFGKGGHDYIDGGRGNDVMVGGSGNDIITGGSGEDTAVYTGNFADYTIEDYDSGWRSRYLGVVDNRPSSPDGHDYVHKQTVEFCVFKDGALNIETREFKEGSYEDTMGNRTPFYVDKYSTVETLTNKTWMGKPVFRKIVYLGDLSKYANNINKWHNIDFGLDDIMDEQTDVKWCGIIPYSFNWGKSNQLRYNITKNNLSFIISTNLKTVFKNVKIMVEYTKK